jgi:large subunit ribosomal protein L30e
MNKNRFDQELRNVVDTGKIIYGTKNVKKDCLINDPKMLVISNTLSEYYKDQLFYYAKLLNIKIIEYPEGSEELGSICGKPFSISALAIEDYGKSSIVDVVESKGEVKKEKGKVLAKRKKLEYKKKKKQFKEQKKIKEKELKKEKEERPIAEDEIYKNILKIKKK